MTTINKKINLDKIQISSPCTEDWNQMTGDERARHCQKCKLNVYNIAEMTRSEAEALIASGLKNKRVCVRIFRRNDGTVMTKDCPVGVRRARIVWIKVQSLRVAMVAFFLSAFSFGRYLVTGELPAPTRIVSAMAGEMTGGMTSAESELMGDVAMPEAGGLTIQPEPQELKGKVKLEDPKETEDAQGSEEDL